MATIFVDRACGLYGLLILAAGALWISDLPQQSTEIYVVAEIIYAVAIAGTVGLAVLLTIGPARLARSHIRVGKIDHILHQFAEAEELYWNRKGRLLIVGLLGILVHVVYALGLSLAAHGLFSDAPSLAKHLVIAPLACIAGALPLTPGGLGSFELAMTVLYDLVSPQHAHGRGLLVALFYRVVTISVAGVGLILYWIEQHAAAAPQSIKETRALVDELTGRDE